MGKIEWQRCFKIPKNRLDQFLVALDTNFTVSGSKPQVEWIFQNGDDYDVVVQAEDAYPWVQGQISTFVAGLQTVEIAKNYYNTEREIEF